MKHKLLIIVFLALGTFSFSQVNAKKYALLWEVTSPSGQSSYVFGSMHSNDRRLFELPDSLYVALNQAEIISLETDIFSLFESYDPQVGTVKLKFDSEGKPYTNSRLASKSSYGDEDGMPQFLDAYFQQYCYNAQKEFYPLETVDFQMTTFVDAFESPSFEEADYSMFLSSKDEMLELYLEGDIYGMNDFIKSALSIASEAYESLIVERNQNMVAKLEEKMASNTVFCAVGAGHLAGEDGILSLFRKKGYKVRRVGATFNEQQSEEEVAVRNLRLYSYSESELGLTISFPGKPLDVELNDNQLIHCVYREFGQGNSYSLELFERGEIESWDDAAAEYLPSPEKSPCEKIKLPNGGEAIQGLGQEYWDNSMKWMRVLLTEEYVIVLKASGGNKFMNSPRAFRFFDTLDMN
ncbi:MAG: hypothetical protein Crog4KO_16870 [Crocinitomicaceae bacterium]